MIWTGDEGVKKSREDEAEARRSRVESYGAV